MDAWRQFQRISRLLGYGARQKIRQVLPFYLERVRFVQDPPSLHQAARSALNLRFPPCPQAEADVLAFHLIGLAAAVEQGVISNDDDLNEMTGILLQNRLDRHSKFVQTLFNILATISDTQDSMIQNLR